MFNIEYIVILLLCFVCLLLVRKLYQFSIMIFDIEESLEESLDVLDEKYRQMNEILQKPIFFDSVEIRQVVNQIKECHSAILNIAQRLTKNMGTLDEIKEENNER